VLANEAEEAGTICRNRRLYQPDVATTLNNLGVKSAGRKSWVSAAIWLKLRKISLAMTLNNNLGSIAWKRRKRPCAQACSRPEVKPRLEQTEEAYREALGIYRRLAKARPEVYQPDVAMTLTNLANVLWKLNRLEETEEAYREALDIFRNLAEARPEIYQPDVATTLNDLGVMLSQLNRLEQAEEAYREALGIYRRLAKARPEVYQPDVAMTLTNLANVLWKLNRLEETEEAYREAIDLDRYNLAGARWRALYGLGILQIAKGNLSEAHHFYSIALTEMEGKRGRLSRLADRLTMQSEYLHIYQRLIHLCYSQGRPEEAWHWVERGKGRSLIDLLSSARPRLDTPEKKSNL
jgi:tetratricopeptide (TPR) repeat protein